ncbi:MAG TPA: hypothetical protein VM050_08750 [Patescibacteria group bacterium]|nr:hypothetical protein [Patescibacteria group bacterium]
MADEYTLRDRVFRAFLRDPVLGPSEMAELLGAKYNSVKAIYAKLSEENLLRRSGRGSYEPDVPGIILNLMDRIETLEKRAK